jgi:DNA primase
MAGKIPNHFIQDLLARIDLVELIDARLPLKRSGSSYIARCPFHNEKSPSFSVSPQKQFYYCFGCGAHGTAISFLMEYDRLSFVEAVETLADNAGLSVPREQSANRVSPEGQLSLTHLYDVQEQACHFYQTQLKTNPAATVAIAYLRERGVSGDVALRYRLGYAPPGHQSLPKNIPQESLKMAGLVTARDSGHSSYDWFRDRIVFPIRDRRGRIVGFGGRIIGTGVPKYLNSPETELFKKHREVYGLFEVLNEVRKPEFILVVEGYMDVIALAQFGISNAVATLGTATSSEHIALLFRYTRDIIFCFDGDTAGRSAAWKALESSLVHLKEGRQLKFLTLPEKHDPDTLIREEGLDQFLARIQMASPFSEYFYEQLCKGIDLTSIEGRAKLVSAAQIHIQKLPQGVFREMIESRLHEFTGQKVESGLDSIAQSPPRGPRSPGFGVAPSALRTFMALLTQNPHLIRFVDAEKTNRLSMLDARGKFIAPILDLLQECPQINQGGLLEYFRDSPTEQVIVKLMAWDTQIGDDRVESEFLDRLRHLTEDRSREHRLSELIEKTRNGQLSPQEQNELRALTTDQA